MRRASRRLARPGTIVVLFVLLVGIAWAPGVANAQPAGYCSELALSDIAPAPMAPWTDERLESADCESSDLTEGGTPVPLEETPTFSGPERPERAWPVLARWSLHRSAARIPIQAATTPGRASHASGVFRPPR